jgi:hypothetical protein
VEATLTAYMPGPADSPIAATSQRPAAVVSPWTETPVRRIAPPPRNPIPVTTDAAIREVSTVTRSSFA